MTILHPIASRFPLTRGRFDALVPDKDPTPAETTPRLRPFGLHFFVTETPAPESVFAYSEEKQVLVDLDGRPVVQGPTASWSQTTTGNMDGNEETMMDQDPDSN